MDEPLLPTLIVMRRELQLLTKAVNELSKTQGQRLVEAWVKKNQACQILGISLRTLNHLLSSEQLKCCKINGLIYIKTDDIKHLLDDHYDNRSLTNPSSTFNTTNND